MFDNSGEKIKSVAGVFCVIGIILSIIVGIVLLATGVELNDNYYSHGMGTVYIWMGIGTAVIGSLLSCVFSLMIAGFGELICSQSSTEKNTREILEKLNSIYLSVDHTSIASPSINSSICQKSNTEPRIISEKSSAKELQTETEAKYNIAESESEDSTTHADLVRRFEEIGLTDTAVVEGFITALLLGEFGTAEKLSWGMVEMDYTNDKLWILHELVYNQNYASEADILNAIDKMD